MNISEQAKREFTGQFPSTNCHCHWEKPYGFVPEVGCSEHDTKKFAEFMQYSQSLTRNQSLTEAAEVVRDYLKKICWDQKDIDYFIRAIEKLKEDV